MEKAILEFEGQKTELDVLVGTENEKAIDIRTLRNKTGLITYDQGFANTGSTASNITFLDGEKGILRYRGYNITDLCYKSNFLETSYLLIFGNLPSKKEFEEFEVKVRTHTMISEEYKKYYDVWPSTAHPMALLASAVSGMSAFYTESLNFDEESLWISTIRLVAKLPTIAAYAYKKSIGQPFIYPLNKLDYCQNFLNMMFALPSESYDINPVFVNALNQLFILHADHEQNCSTSAVRLIGSSHANVYAAIAGGILALWGPLHGGANQAVIEMLHTIKNDRSSIKKYVDRAKDPHDPFRLMGFGHRVYKNFDPRASVIKQTCHQVIAALDHKEDLLDIALELEDIAINDSYFIEKRLYPNVDFYSGIIYMAMNIPINMYTVMFALGRIPGWIAHWREMITSPDTRIARPRQIYQGNVAREYVPLKKR